MVTIKKLFLWLVLAFLPFAFTNTHAEPVIDKVVAVVGEHIITRQDLDRRFQLVLRQLGQGLNQQKQKALYTQTLNILIDEEIKRRTALDFGLVAPPQEVVGRLTSLHETAGLTPEQFEKITSGLEDTLKNQVEADVLWKKLVERNIRSQIVISTDEIDQLIQNLAAGNTVTENQISQIFIAHGQKEEQNAETIIKDVAAQLQAGADFEQLARDYSQHGSSMRGGFMGWFKAGELAPILEKAITELEKGSLTQPIRGGAGWHIVKLNDRRQSDLVNLAPIRQVHLIQFTTPLPADKEKEKAVRNILEKIKDKTDSLADAEDVLNDKKLKPLLEGSASLGWLEEKNVPPAFKPLLEDTKPGDHIGPFEKDGHLTLLYFEGERKTMSDALETYRERVRTRMIDNRTELAARRYLRDLRRNTFIDVRL